MRAWLLGPLVVVALTLAAAGWLTVRDVPVVVTWLDIGSPGDSTHISGAFPPEHNQTETYRWTTQSALVTVPAPAGSRYRVDVSIAAIGDQPRRLTLSCPDGKTTAQLATGQTPPVVTLECRSDGEIPIQISVPEIRVNGDGRPLGVALRDIRVTSLDRDLTAIWRLHAGLIAAAALIGIWFATAALAGTRAATAASASLAIVAIAITTRHPVWTLSMVAGPGALITLAAGYASWLLRQSCRSGPFLLGLIAVTGWIVVRPPSPSTLLPALWTSNDRIGYLLLPWLAALAIIAASLIGGQRSAPLAATAAYLSAGSMLLPIALRPTVERWSLTIDGPDWTDPASVAGAALLISTALIVMLGLRAIPKSSQAPLANLLIVLALALAILVPWRNSIMGLNGDEPHYYVTAHSLAADADLELLDDYLDPSYQSATISPTGNIAVERDTGTDRYAAFTPDPPASYDLVPGESAGLSPADDDGRPPASTAQLIVTDQDGNDEALPSLTPSTTLTIPISGPCNIDSLLLSPVSATSTTATIRLLDADGTQVWQNSTPLDGRITQLRPPLDRAVCDERFSGSIQIDAAAAVIAEAIDTASGLRILPAQPAATDWLLGPLPRDQYATQEATARLTLFNPDDASVEARVRLLTTSDTLLRAIGVSLGPGQTVTLDLDLQAGVAIAISAPKPIIAGAVGWLPGGSYAIPLMPEAAVWQFDVQPAPDRDGGVWLALANDTPEQRHVTLTDFRASRTLTICAHCATMLHLQGDNGTRSATITSDGGPIAVAAVAYEERTGSLHFDLGLPLLAALPVRLAGPDGAPIVSVVAVLVLAAGLYVLLRRTGVANPLAAWSAAAIALLAPLAPYAVRLYTEPLAACLIVWSLVYWDSARQRPLLAAASLVLAGMLPLVHGRYTPLACVLAILAVSAGLRHARASRRQLMTLAVVAVVVIVAVAISPLAVALRDRAGLGYFSTEWVPRSLPGIFLDRGSGLVPFAPWLLLAFAAPRPLRPLQWAAMLLFLVQLGVVMLRAGGWQTFGPPARYMLPVVPLLVLLVSPGVAQIWRSLAGRALVAALLAWSAAVTTLLLWLPLSGYVFEGRYFIDNAVEALAPLAPINLFPAITPAASSNLAGLILLLLVWGCATGALLRARR